MERSCHLILPNPPFDMDNLTAFEKLTLRHAMRVLKATAIKNSLNLSNWKQLKQAREIYLMRQTDTAPAPSKSG